jgi:hypothetical protein
LWSMAIVLETSETVNQKNKPLCEDLCFCVKSLEKFQEIGK